MDTQYLERHGSHWRVTVPVPKKLQPMVGKRRLKRTLPTDSLATANHLKHGVIAELKREMRRLVRATPQDKLVEEALQARGMDEDLIDIQTDLLLGDPIDEDQDGPLYDPKKERQASLFRAVATGNETPLMALIGPWHAQEVNRKERTKGDDRRALGLLEAWCRASGTRPTLQAISRAAAGKFIESLVGQMTNRTANKYISSLSAYWKWLKRRGVVSENPWQGQSLPKERRHPDDQERPFTDEEVKRLLEGEPPGRLRAVMMIAALSGARIDAIVSLKVRDCQEGLFRYKPQKREQGHRYVPIHSHLKDILADLVRGKAQEDDVFPEYPVPRAGTQQERSMPAVKAFTRYRRSIGVDDTRPGLKRSLTNFHSFRRWFITRAEQAGQPENVIASVVGHKRPGMTLGLYSRGPSTDQLRACVEAVRLP